MSVTTRDEIRRWLGEAQKTGATHLIVACDTFDNEDFPVFVKPGEDVREIEAQYRDEKKMLRVMEVYSLKLDIESQLAEHRAFHYD